MMYNKQSWPAFATPSEVLFLHACICCTSPNTVSITSTMASSDSLVIADNRKAFQLVSHQLTCQLKFLPFGQHLCSHQAMTRKPKEAMIDALLTTSELIVMN